MTWINAKHQFSIQQVELRGLANRCKCGNHSFSTKIKLNSEKKELELWDWQNKTIQYPCTTWGEVIELMWMEPIGIDDHWGPLLDSYRWTLNSRQCQCTLNIPPCGVRAAVNHISSATNISNLILSSARRSKNTHKADIAEQIVGLVGFP